MIDDGLASDLYSLRSTFMRSPSTTIAAKSPLSIRGVKESLNYARDHSVADGLNYIATWNAAMLMSKDLTEAMMANMGKRAAVFKGE